MHPSLIRDDSWPLIGRVGAVVEGETVRESDLHQKHGTVCIHIDEADLFDKRKETHTLHTADRGDYPVCRCVAVVKAKTMPS